ncbi:aspartate/glutamate racemase family protein [Arthrobacter sp. lap29]|uniref:aspartate/glutamate racemase family protein n=1 Tax=Arthrobacter sp. lap29 TaxID=3056122 RepID=UPI0028F7441B|nr:aspartate/glutamate racemase family protein [Arthrobacter sp. lap29]
MSTKRRVILMVNPNTNPTTTAMMQDLATLELRGSGLAAVGITAFHGPRMIIDPASLEAAATHVLDVVRTYLAGPDGPDVVAIMVAAIGDPGRQELSEEVTVPVVGIGEASILAASEGGRTFGMATSTPLLVPSLRHLVMNHDRAEYFRGVKLTTSGPLALAADPQQQLLELRQAVGESVASGAQAVIIAGGPLSETARRLSAENIAVIIEPIPSACRLVLTRLGTDLFTAD